MKKKTDGMSQEKICQDNWHVYLVLCKDKTFYCGISNDVEKRIEKHNSGNGSKYINSKRRPVKLVYSTGPFSKSEASKEEYRIKKMSKKKKEEIIKNGI